MTPRSNFEDLVIQIVERTTEKNKKAFGKRLAIHARTCKWTEMDLHALLAKAKDPKIRNYTAFVKYMMKLTYLR